MSVCSCPAGRRWRGSSIRSRIPTTAGSTCLETDLRLDADDSFRRGSTEVGWAIGAGFEMPLAARWALRFDGSYLDFGSETYRVNLSGNNSCGPGGGMTACRYTVRNKLGVVRLGIVYRLANRECRCRRMRRRTRRTNLLGVTVLPHRGGPDGPSSERPLGEGIGSAAHTDLTRRTEDSTARPNGYVRGKRGCTVVVNDDKYGPGCAGVGLNPLAICLRKKSNRNRGNLNCTQMS